MNFKLIISILFISKGLIAQPPLAHALFSTERGFYYEYFDLTISADTADASIRYTIDGSDPATSSTAIINTAPVTITINPTNVDGRDTAPGFVVRACVEKNSVIISDVITHTYLFPELVELLSPDGQKPGPNWPEENFDDNGIQFFNYGMDAEVLNDPRYQNDFLEAMLSIPTISLVTDLKNLFDPDSGIYVNAQYHGKAWERPTSVELLNPDGSSGFHINAGLRIRGGWSRHNYNPKHAFRLFFRTEYGEGKLRYPLFGDEGVDEFDKVDLRTSQNYSWSYDGGSLNTMNRDVFSRDLQGETGNPYTRSRYYHLYINGTYWGLFQTQERSEASFAEEYLGGLREDYDVIKIDIGDNWDVYNIEATDGNLDAWQRLWELAHEGFASDEAYYKVQGLNADGTINQAYEKYIDIDNLIDYMLITFLVGDFDGPVSNFRDNTGANNFYAIYNRNNPNGFIFLRHDAEHSLLDNPWGLDRTGPFSAGESFDQFNPQWLHQKLAEHPEYRLRMADKIYKYFFYDGIFTPNANIDRFLARKEEIDLAIIAESARWGDSKSYPARTKDDDWLPAINHIVEDYFPARSAVVLEQLINKAWYPEINVPQFGTSSGIVSNGYRLTMGAEQGNIYYTLDGSDPHIPYSVADSNQRVLVTNKYVKRILVPSQNIADNWKSDPDFDDSNWSFSNGLPGGIGYENDIGYESYISYDVGSYMFDDGNNPQANTSCYIRIPFSVSAQELSDFTYLTLNIQYDDGFAAYLNGTEIVRVNAPASLTWDALATQNHEADYIETFDISDYLPILVEGQNLLAIHGLNISTTSSDFLIKTEIEAGSKSIGSEISANARAYAEPVIISEHSSVRARVLLDDQWSAINEVNLWMDNDLNYLIISEIHYHPLDNDSVNDRELEFIELKNIGSETIDLSQKYFSKGINYSFLQGVTIEAGEAIVLASNKIEFEKRYGFTPFAEYSGQLNNGGEKIALNNSTGDTLINISYNDNFPWPNSTDGSGYTLVVKSENPTLDFNKAVNWQSSSIIHGTPGFDEVSSVEEDQAPILKPQSFKLNQNYPNPFNGYTKIEYTLPKNSNVKIKIFNIVGQTIRTIVNENQNAGYKSIIWDGKNETGKRVASGIYIYSLIIDEKYFNAKRMLFIK